MFNPIENEGKSRTKERENEHKEREKDKAIRRLFTYHAELQDRKDEIEESSSDTLKEILRLAGGQKTFNLDGELLTIVERKGGDGYFLRNVSGKAKEV